MTDRRPFAFAGLWDHWVDPAGVAVESCATITTSPSALLAPIHDRMPAILAPDDFALWLDPAVSDPAPLGSLHRPHPAEEMAAWPFRTVVNNPGIDAPRCIEPLPG